MIFVPDVKIMLKQEQHLFSSIRDTLSMVDKYDDLAKLSLLTEDILLEHLKQRYEKDLIYVSIIFSYNFIFFIFSYLDISWRYSCCRQSIS